MEEAGKMESNLSSASAFVEGGIQDASDDACSICLEEFCEHDPSTVTCCKHEFHLHCILEWCQRSSQCPMCWQAISLKDPISQELFEGVERERNIMVNLSRNSTIFHHLPANDSEIEEHIIQHLAAAAAMSRSHHIAGREGQRGRPSAHGHPPFLLFSSNPNASSIPATSAHGEGASEPGIAGISTIPSVTEAPWHQASHIFLGQADEITLPSNGPVFSSSRIFAGQSSLNNQDSAGTSDLQSFSESLKSRLSSVSMRYKDSITKSTRGWKERFFSSNTSMSDIGSEVRREFNAGIATVSRMMERLDTGDNTRETSDSAPGSSQDHAVTDMNNESVTESHANTLPSNTNISASCPASSGPN